MEFYIEGVQRVLSPGAKRVSFRKGAKGPFSWYKMSFMLKGYRELLLLVQSEFHIEGVHRVLSPGAKRPPGHESDFSPPSTASI